MPMPKWWGQINKRIFNPRALNGDKWDVLTHKGRSTGKEYQTPMELIPVPGGYVVFLVYGEESDWVKNTLASGSATICTGGTEVRVINPRLVSVEEMESVLPADCSRPPGLLRITKMLRMDVAAN